ncbi:hypothetical protein BJ742DRAFT_767856 [Cladochytrium replicatum]|nr:hypothetical protein BJ742DRAFT_767856 [Cladochytrium replicatum]
MQSHPVRNGVGSTLVLAAQCGPSSSERADAADSSSDNEPPIRLNLLHTHLTAVARAKPIAGAQPPKKDAVSESARTTPKPKKRGTANDELASSPTREIAELMSVQCAFEVCINGIHDEPAAVEPFFT